MIKPPDCYGKTELPKALGMGYESFYRVANDPRFPPPDGYYNGKPPACKSFPYWHIDTVKNFFDSIDIKLIAKSTNKAGCRMQNKTPWAVPAYDRNESIVSLRAREFLKLMRVAA
jgi:hypothetical protein